MVNKAVKALSAAVYAVAASFRDAWYCLMTWLFVGGQASGYWKLATVGGKPRKMHITQKLEDLIMWTGIITSSVVMAIGICKLAIWQGWI